MAKHKGGRPSKLAKIDLGEVERLAGQIFSWDVAELPQMAFDEIFWGGDFGYSIDPAAVVKIYRRADEFWIEEKLYQNRE